MWQFGLVLIGLIVLLISFAVLVERGAREGVRAGPISKTTLSVARLPSTTKSIVNEVILGRSKNLADGNRFEGQAGFRLVDNSAHAGDMLLLTRFDGDEGRAIVELVDLDTGTVSHTYRPDIDGLRRRLNAQEREKNPVRENIIEIGRTHRPGKYRIIHPILGDDASLTFHGMHTPLVKIDACDEIQWTTFGIFHHAIEQGGNGNIWTAGQIAPSTIDFTLPDFSDDSIAKIAPDGTLLFERSVSQIFIDNELAHLVYTGDEYVTDPIHLNDVQHVLEDGAFWQKGDVFLSVRHRSLIALYRPSTNEIIWHQQGPWMMQHDVDVISDHEIAIFDNNMATFPYGELVLGTNNAVIFDFETGQTRSPYKTGFDANAVKTINQGLSTILPNGDIFVEEQNWGRVLVMAPGGEIRWDYVNRAEDGNVYQVFWTRYIPAAHAHNVKASLENSSCDE
jgi:hypothetical protein